MKMYKEILGWVVGTVVAIVFFAASCAVVGFVVGFGVSIAGMAYRFWN